ncbi:enoyl-CoA hydratase/isomerase family protein [Oceanibaculum pacificum]|uniref:Enoyl-CoA hydratase n=1 Tax=Oceanibaculum pacificum TaxID=580166 RepID=A0A154VW53_9PROT|nr:enoyl-CoA hydratase-related protein [Oceanibaculum pacificum]KZD05500.1 enoyl-CoA hydratase [Oceanibaculum pacificum]
MSEQTILTEVQGRIGIITVNRPQVMNALDVPTVLALEQALDGMEKNAEVRVIVVTGAGEKAFVAGGDIADMNSRQALDHYIEFAEVIHRVFRRFELSDKPTIAAVNGWALGGGTELLLSLDIRIAAETAKVGLPEITLGLIPGAGGTQRMIRQIPLCKAKELMFAGAHITAAEALSFGLINRIVPKDRLMAEVMELAERIAHKSPLILKVMKRTIRDGADMPLPSALAHEQAMASLIFDSADAHEGCTAFLEKRNAVFTGK